VLTAHKVSTRVNSPRNDEQSLVEPLAEAPKRENGEPTLW
jgi:hypothetical protein